MAIISRIIILCYLCLPAFNGYEMALTGGINPSSLLMRFKGAVYVCVFSHLSLCLFLVLVLFFSWCLEYTNMQNWVSLTCFLGRKLMLEINYSRTLSLQVGLWECFLCALTARCTAGCWATSPSWRRTWTPWRGRTHSWWGSTTTCSSPVRRWRGSMMRIRRR